jgi:hypothetical protein
MGLISTFNYNYNYFVFRNNYISKFNIFYIGNIIKLKSCVVNFYMFNYFFLNNLLSFIILIVVFKRYPSVVLKVIKDKYNVSKPSFYFTQNLVGKLVFDFINYFIFAFIPNFDGEAFNLSIKHVVNNTVCFNLREIPLLYDLSEILLLDYSIVKLIRDFRLIIIFNLISSNYNYYSHFWLSCNKLFTLGN